MSTPTHELRTFVLADDLDAVSDLLTRHAELRQRLDAGMFDWQKPALAAARR